jgi:uroporphyrinogen decarboxylase
MTSRQRVLNTLNHEPTDRMPIDLGMHNSTGISAFAYWRLREYLGLPVHTVDAPDINQMLARVEDDVLQRFHCDCIMLAPPWPRPHIWEPRPPFRFRFPDTAQPRRRADGSWVMERGGETLWMPANGYFFQGGWGDFAESDPDARLRAVAVEAERIYRETSYFTTYLDNFFGYCGADSPEWGCRAILEPAAVYAENAAVNKRQLAHAGKVVEALAPWVQAVCFNSDLGWQGGPMIRPSLYQAICAPFVKSICDFIHANSDMKVFMHSCGAIKPLIPILIECGIDALNPVQIAAADMRPADLKREFGPRITFWGGGCDTQHVLPVASPAEISAHVRENVHAFAPGGGYVFNQVHNILGDVRPESIVAMYDTAYAEAFAFSQNVV